MKTITTKTAVKKLLVLNTIGLLKDVPIKTSNGVKHVSMFEVVGVKLLSGKSSRQKLRK